jgi:hypothetical protein
MRFGNFGQLAEHLAVIHGKFRQHLSVHFNRSLVQSIDESVVGKAVQSCGGIDTGYPEPSELSFAGFPVAIRKTQASINGFVRDSIHSTFSAVISFRHLQNFAPAVA